MMMMEALTMRQVLPSTYDTDARHRTASSQAPRRNISVFYNRSDKPVSRQRGGLSESVTEKRKIKWREDEAE